MPKKGRNPDVLKIHLPKNGWVSYEMIVFCGDYKFNKKSTVLIN